MLHAGMEPLRTDSLLTRTDGADVERVMLDRMRAWYADMLATQPADKLPLSDMAAEIEVSIDESGAGTAMLPARCLRVVLVMAHGWERPAVIVTDPESDLAAEQACEFTRGGTVSPVAVIDHGVMKLYTPPGGNAKLSRVLCVMRPPEGTYLLTDAMKGLLPTYEPTL